MKQSPGISPAVRILRDVIVLLLLLSNFAHGFLEFFGLRARAPNKFYQQEDIKTARAMVSFYDERQTAQDPLNQDLKPIIALTSHLPGMSAPLDFSYISKRLTGLYITTGDGQLRSYTQQLSLVALHLYYKARHSPKPKAKLAQHVTWPEKSHDRALGQYAHSVGVIDQAVAISTLKRCITHLGEAITDNQQPYFRSEIGPIYIPGRKAVRGLALLEVVKLLNFAARYRSRFDCAAFLALTRDGKMLEIVKEHVVSAVIKNYSIHLDSSFEDAILYNADSHHYRDLLSYLDPKDRNQIYTEILVEAFSELQKEVAELRRTGFYIETIQLTSHLSTLFEPDGLNTPEAEELVENMFHTFSVHDTRDTALNKVQVHRTWNLIYHTIQHLTANCDGFLSKFESQKPASLLWQKIALCNEIEDFSRHRYERPSWKGDVKTDQALPVAEVLQKMKHSKLRNWYNSRFVEYQEMNEKIDTYLAKNERRLLAATENQKLRTDAGNFERISLDDPNLSEEIRMGYWIIMSGFRFRQKAMLEWKEKADDSLKQEKKVIELTADK